MSCTYGFKMTCSICGKEYCAHVKTSFPTYSDCKGFLEERIGRKHTIRIKLAKPGTILIIVNSDVVKEFYDAMKEFERYLPAGVTWEWKSFQAHLNKYRFISAKNKI